MYQSASHVPSVVTKKYRTSTGSNIGGSMQSSKSEARITGSKEAQAPDTPEIFKTRENSKITKGGALDRALEQFAEKDLPDMKRDSNATFLKKSFQDLTQLKEEDGTPYRVDPKKQIDPVGA